MIGFKEIHIGILINQKVAESEIDVSRICNFFKNSEEEIEVMYKSRSLDSEILLKWSKLLGFDFFRIYTQHLILFCPQESVNYNQRSGQKKSSLPQFRKNIYTKEIIDYVLELIKTGELTKLEVIEKYRIPKTTLYKWISKYKT